MKERQTMRFLVIPALLTACAVSGLAQTADRVYSADQTSNMVSVIDPAANKLLASIHLRDDRSEEHTSELQSP